MLTFHSTFYLVEQFYNKPTKILRATSKKLPAIQRSVCKTDQIKSEQNSEFKKNNENKNFIKGIIKF